MQEKTDDVVNADIKTETPETVSGPKGELFDMTQNVCDSNSADIKTEGTEIICGIVDDMFNIPKKDCISKYPDTEIEPNQTICGILNEMIHILESNTDDTGIKIETSFGKIDNFINTPPNTFIAPSSEIKTEAIESVYGSVGNLNFFKSGIQIEATEPICSSMIELNMQQGTDNAAIVDIKLEPTEPVCIKTNNTLNLPQNTGVAFNADIKSEIDSGSMNEPNDCVSINPVHITEETQILCCNVDDLLYIHVPQKAGISKHFDTGTASNKTIYGSANEEMVNLSCTGISLDAFIESKDSETVCIDMNSTSNKTHKTISYLNWNINNEIPDSASIAQMTVLKDKAQNASVSLQIDDQIEPNNCNLSKEFNIQSNTGVILNQEIAMEDNKRINVKKDTVTPMQLSRIKL